MADFVRINEHSNKGDLVISKKVIKTIVDESTNRVLSESLGNNKNINLSSPTNVLFKKDGKVEIEIGISLSKKENAQEICLKVQQEIAHDLAIYTESVPFEIEITILDVK